MEQIWLWVLAAVLIVAVLMAALRSARVRSAEASPDTAHTAGTADTPADPADTVQATNSAAPPAGDSALAALDANRAGAVAPSTFQTAASVVADAVTRPGPHPGSALPSADGSSPSADYPIKANTGAGRFYLPESPYFVRTRADLWFRTAATAEAAGLTAASARRDAT